MSLFLGLIGLYIAFKFFGALATHFTPVQNGDAHINGISPCPLHDWEYHDGNGMICAKCKGRPGSV